MSTAHVNTSNPTGPVAFLPGGVLGHQALVVELHVELEPADFTEQHVPLVHDQVELRPQVVDLLALLVDDLHSLLQRDTADVGRVTAVHRLAAAQSIGGLLQPFAVVAHVLDDRRAFSVSHNTAESAGTSTRDEYAGRVRGRTTTRT